MTILKMKKISKHYILIILNFTIIIFYSQLTIARDNLIASPPPQQPPFTRIYAFGDSYTDTGNTFSAKGPSGSLPYGMTYFHHPTYRYSDGRLVMDFVSDHLSLPFLPPYKNITNIEKAISVNFAVGGATAIEHDFFVTNNFTFDKTLESLGTELNWINNVLEKQGCGNNNDVVVKCGALFDDTLIWVGEIGANDYAYTSLITSIDYRKSVVQVLAIKRVSDFLEFSVRAKYVVIQGLPPTGCLTLAMVLAPTNDRDDMGCVRSENDLISNHNKLLLAEIQGLRNRYPKAFIVYADYYNAYREIMKNRAKYGFEEAFKACCGSGGGDYNLFSTCGSTGSSWCSNPSRYINWDGVHLTEAMYKAVARLLLEGGYSRPSFDEMIDRKNSHGRGMYVS
ncbi:hypothetical protein RND81_04G112100 [Saponaria officinalis]|uniref:Uncharacterized protein n=1 Tax=Saponaria officinalis TaxID=3572 RepID=A0AAW1LJU7_SAPOF